MEINAFEGEGNELQKRQEEQKGQKGSGFVLFDLLAFFAVNRFPHRTYWFSKYVLTSVLIVLFEERSMSGEIRTHKRSAIQLNSRHRRVGNVQSPFVANRQGR